MWVSPLLSGLVQNGKVMLGLNEIPINAVKKVLSFIGIDIL